MNIPANTKKLEKEKLFFLKRIVDREIDNIMIKNSKAVFIETKENNRDDFNNNQKDHKNYDDDTNYNKNNKFKLKKTPYNDLDALAKLILPDPTDIVLPHKIYKVHFFS